MLIDAEFKESINPSAIGEPLLALRVKKAASVIPDAAVAKCYCRCSEGEVHAGADHAEVVLRPINEIPAEITNQADMRRKANFQTAAHLTQCLRLGICMTNRLDNVEAFSSLVNKSFAKPPVDLLLATTKDCATSAKNVGRKARTVKRIAQCERAQHRADHVALVMNAILKDVVAEIDEDILACLPRISGPAFNADPDVTREKVLQIDATAPSVIGLDVAVIYPISPRENVCAPNRDVKLSVRVPLRTRRRSYLFHLFPGIANSGKSAGTDHTGPQQA